MTTIRAKWHLADADSQRLTSTVAWQLRIYIDGEPFSGPVCYSMTEPTQADARRIVRRLHAAGILPVRAMRQAAA